MTSREDERLWIEAFFPEVKGDFLGVVDGKRFAMTMLHAMMHKVWSLKFMEKNSEHFDRLLAPLTADDIREIFESHLAHRDHEYIIK